MKKWWLPGVALCLGLSGSETRAWSYGNFISCNAINPNPAITFKTSYGKLVHDLSKSQAEVSSLAHSSNEPGWLTVGFAQAPVVASISSKGTARKIDDDVTCVLPDEIEIFVGYQKPVIYVSKEYREDLCKFSVVIRHEQVHQRINKLTLDYFVPLMDKVLRKAIYEVRGIKVNSEAQAQEGMALLRSYYLARLTPILEEMAKAQKAEHAKMDSLTSYKMQWDMCEKFKERQERDKFLKKMEAKRNNPAG